MQCPNYEMERTDLNIIIVLDVPKICTVFFRDELLVIYIVHQGEN